MGFFQPKSCVFFGGSFYCAVPMECISHQLIVKAGGFLCFILNILPKAGEPPKICLENPKKNSLYQECHLISNTYHPGKLSFCFEPEDHLIEKENLPNLHFPVQNVTFQWFLPLNPSLIALKMGHWGYFTPINGVYVTYHLHPPTTYGLPPPPRSLSATCRAVKLPLFL